MSASEPQGATATRKRFRLGPGQIAGLVVVVLAIIFIVQNRTEVRVYFFTATVTAPLWLLLTIMAAVGLVVGILLRWRAGKTRRG
ncbi:lipopolysaccharide assembly protein LapA domain-containing protein [Amycolatopsis pithecellobii]|nr:LapA family protein [Amycolatopsis pithecellobii]